MRPQQQNRRMRGRNNNNNNNSGNNNRRGPNPLTRSYESNGPDVKIRGSAQQIADKYMQLARDAQSSGDRVMAENYLQHAEHYNRIIAAAQAQMPQHMVRDIRDDMDDDGDDERDDMTAANQGADGSRPAQDGSGPQPVIEGMPAEVALGQDGGSGEQNGQPHDERSNGAQGDGEDGGQRRNRRPRRGRGRPDFGARGEHDSGDRNSPPMLQQNEGGAEARSAPDPEPVG
jgi:hypothetical protein